LAIRIAIRIGARLQNRIFHGSDRFARRVLDCGRWTAAFGTRENHPFSKVLVRAKVPLKPAQSKRSATQPVILKFENTPSKKISPPKS